MPSTLPTDRERSSARTNALPMSPVGPVTATVSGLALGLGFAFACGLRAHWPRRCASSRLAMRRKRRALPGSRAAPASIEPGGSSNPPTSLCGTSDQPSPSRHEVAAHLEVALPLEVGRVVVRGRGRRGRARAGTPTGVGVEPHAVGAAVERDRDATGEREAVRRDERRAPAGRSASPSSSIRASQASAAALGRRREASSAPRRARSAPPRCASRCSSGSDRDVAARPDVRPLGPHVHVEARVVPAQEPARNSGGCMLLGRRQLLDRTRARSAGGWRRGRLVDLGRALDEHHRRVVQAAAAGLGEQQRDARVGLGVARLLRVAEPGVTSIAPAPGW